MPATVFHFCLSFLLLAFLSACSGSGLQNPGSPSLSVNGDEHPKWPDASIPDQDGQHQDAQDQDGQDMEDGASLEDTREGDGAVEDSIDPEEDLLQDSTLPEDAEEDGDADALEDTDELEDGDSGEEDLEDSQEDAGDSEDSDAIEDGDTGEDAGEDTGAPSCDDEAPPESCDDGSFWVCDETTEFEAKCLSWKDCDRGEYISEPGTKVSDRECEPCQEGTFSSAPNQASCEPFTECNADEGYYEETPGTAENDRICGINHCFELRCEEEESCENNRDQDRCECLPEFFEDRTFDDEDPACYSELDFEWTQWPIPEPTRPDQYKKTTEDGKDIVMDVRTGLEWEASGSDSGMSWDEALDYCARLNTEAYQNWRLPTAIELLSIVDYYLQGGGDSSKTFPSINETYFPGTARDHYWTASENAVPSAGSQDPFETKAWAVDFAGSVSFSRTGPSTSGGGLSSQGKSNDYRVRCVRLPGTVQLIRDEAEAPDERFVFEIGNTVLTDHKSELEWRRSSSSNNAECTNLDCFSYTEAIDACNGLNHQNWRLPNIKEIASLMDRRDQEAPLVDPMLEALFATTRRFWASASNKSWTFWSNRYDDAGIIDFSTGAITRQAFLSSGTNRVKSGILCVRDL